MEKFYSPTYNLEEFATLTVRYGQEPAAEDIWKKIVNIEDKRQRNLQIDQLIDLLSINTDETGFFDKNTGVVVKGVQNGFVLDDASIYHDFFDILRNVYLKNIKENTNHTEGAMIMFSIQETLEAYFGRYKAGNAKLRLETTQAYFDAGQEVFRFPSIKNQKGKNSAVCAENASLAHNLWLMTGKKSYYVNSKFTKFSNVDKEFEDDGHAFCIVEYGGKFRLFDADMKNFALLEGDPIEKLLCGKPLFVSGKGICNPGLYGLTGNEKEK